MNLTIKGVTETINNLNRVEKGIGSDKPMKAATQLVTREAKKNTPVDLGTTRASITPSIRSSRNEIEGIVGSNRKSALFAEKGTRPHWPPLKAVEGWARRHGMTAYLVALAVSRKGTKAHRMLENALKDNQGKIIREFQNYYNRLVD
jgi:HK97 gp10 family phage protein